MNDNKFPNGKLNDEDEGELAIAISIENGTVRFDFKKPVGWFAMSPDMAMDIAEAIIATARKAGCKKR